MTYSGVKVFSATRSEDRTSLGEKVTAWARSHLELEVVETKVLQSSDNAYHCLTIVVFYDGRKA